MTFDDLLAAAQRDPGGVDFHDLRMAYTRTDDYRPYTHDTAHLDALKAALRENDLDAALEAVHHLLDNNYLDIEAHMAADYLYLQQEDEARSAYHRTFAKGLLDAITATGDGRGPDSAFIVISVPEEYTVLKVLGLKPSQQTLVQHAGHWFDVFDVPHPNRGSAKLYFNIDLPRGWLDAHMGEE
jgi:hypothetical protein